MRAARLWIVACLTPALLAADLLSSASAWAQSAAQPPAQPSVQPPAERLELQAVSACADADAIAELESELALRLPELQVGPDTSPLIINAYDIVEERPSARWRLFWVPEGNDRCMVLLRTSSLEHRATLGPDADADAIREVASRLAWVITAAREAEADEARTHAEDLAQGSVERAREVATAAPESSASSAPPDAFTLEVTRQNAASLASDTAELARGVALARPPSSSPVLAPQPEPPTSKGGVRLGVIPGVSLGSDNALLTLNIVGSHRAFDGAQLGFINHIEEQGSGPQVGLVASWVDGSLSGAQVSSTFNYANRLRGAQVSTINVSNQHRGVQVGVVNIASELQGTQVGMVNISKNADWPVGLVNIATDYPPRLFGYYALPGHIYTGLSMGGRRLRYIFQSGTALFGNSGSIGVGAGLHLPFDDRPYFADIDAVIMFAEFGTAALGTHVHLRAPLGWRFAKRFALIAGPSLNVFFTESSSTRDYGSPVALVDLQQNNELLQIWVDLMVGLVF